MSADSSNQSSNHPKKTSSDKKREILIAKQAQRKFRGASAPDPSLGVSLEDFTEFTTHLKSSKRILALIGAGLSASSGIATFRGHDRLWRGEDQSDLSDAEVFSSDPLKVWWLFTDRMRKAQDAKPNAAHYALTKLAKRNPEFFAINQNIDGLCERASFPKGQMAQLHGTLFSLKCSKSQSTKDPCDYETESRYPINTVLTIPANIDISNPNVPLPQAAVKDLPHCPKCHHLLRPNVVFFGEATPMQTRKSISDFIAGGPIDLMLVIGTSATVMSSAMYIPTARNAGARIAFFNVEESDEEPARIWVGDWFFKGNAASMVPDMLKGVIGSTGGG